MSGRERARMRVPVCASPWTAACTEPMRSGEEQEIPIVQDGVTTNVLTIRDGRADMTEADCPDKLCVHQKAISKNHEMIVCLPNKVVVEVTGSEENGFDSIAR